nr:ankyrin repeat [Pandoravirus massiliensis]
MTSSDGIAPAAPTTTIGDLPCEIIAHILAWLDHADYRACRATARLWRVCTPAAYARRVLDAPCPPCPRDLVLSGDSMAIRGLLASGRLDSGSCAWMTFWAAWHGHLDLLMALHEFGVAGFDRDIMDRAAGFGRLDMVTFLHDNRREGCTTYAMNRAAAKGHLAVVDFLHRHRSEGCTRRAMDYAAASGHLDIVIYLNVNRSEGCTVGAINRAATNGHRDIVAYLLEHRQEGASPSAMAAAAANGDLDMLRLLIKWGQPCDHRAMDAAAANGRVAALEYLDSALGLGCTAEALVSAASARHFDAVTFLLDRRLGDIAAGLPAAAHEALAAGRVDLVQRIWGFVASTSLAREARAPVHTPPAVFTGVAAGGHTDALNLLYWRDPYGFVKNADRMLAAAVAHGRRTVVDYLLSVGSFLGRFTAQKARRLVEQAVVDAAGRGHADATELLHRTIAVSSACLKKAAIAAATNGHLDTLKTINNLCHGEADDCHDVAEAAARGGHIGILACVMPPPGAEIRYGPMCTLAKLAVRAAASVGRDDVIEWLATRYLDCATPLCPKAIGAALAGGHVSTLRLLCGAGSSDVITDGHIGLHRIADAPSQSAWDHAARAGHLAAIAYLCKRGIIPRNTNVMAQAAIEGGHLNVVKFAYHALHSFDPQRALAEARAYSRHEIALWISDALSWGVPKARAGLFRPDWPPLYSDDDVVCVWRKRRPGKTVIMREILEIMNGQQAPAVMEATPLSPCVQDDDYAGGDTGNDARAADCNDRVGPLWHL